jgi:hypothetical protein
MEPFSYRRLSYVHNGLEAECIILGSPVRKGGHITDVYNSCLKYCGDIPTGQNHAKLRLQFPPS